jgi:hypothetical protein
VRARRIHAPLDIFFKAVDLLRTTTAPPPDIARNEDNKP